MLFEGLDYMVKMEKHLINLLHERRPTRVTIYFVFENVKKKYCNWIVIVWIEVFLILNLL
jgi:hypothetical protein